MVDDTSQIETSVRRDDAVNYVRRDAGDVAESRVVGLSYDSR